MNRNFTTGFRVARTADGGAPALESEPLPEDPKWAAHSQHLPFTIGYDNGLAKARVKNKPLMLFVTTTWCGWCKKHAQENFNDEAVKALLDKFVLVIVDGDTERDALAKLGATRGFPHFIFQSSTGERLAEQLGYAPVNAFKKVVEDALAKSGQAGGSSSAPN
jgi:thiol:disulfide interchange protein